MVPSITSQNTGVQVNAVSESPSEQGDLGMELSLRRSKSSDKLYHRVSLDFPEWVDISHDYVVSMHKDTAKWAVILR